MAIFHSRNKPKVRAFKKKTNKKILAFARSPNKAKLGNKIISSKSKIRKMRASTKNRMEKGRRPSLSVEKPHSKGDKNSRLLNHFLDTPNPAASRIPESPALNSNSPIHISIK